jgi:hypothetical protein
MALKLSTVQLSRELANSALTRTDCALLRPLAQKSTLSIHELSGASANDAGEASAGGEGSRTLGANAPLPCLRVNNSNESSGDDLKAAVSANANLVASVPAWVRKSEFIVKSNIAAMVEKFGIDCIGFLTLTFADDVQNHKEAAKRFNSLATGVLNTRYSQWVRVSERQKSGRWHFHLVVVCKQDIRRGVDFAAIAKRDYKSANGALRAEWSFWRNTAKKYGFGRSELLPVKKTGEALAAYVAKYISKGFAYRRADDKGARLVSYSKNARVCGSRFSFVGGKVQAWRLRCRLFLAHTYHGYYQKCLVDGLTPLPAFTYDDMPLLFGKRWAWRLRDRILSPMFFNPFY